MVQEAGLRRPEKALTAQAVKAARNAGKYFVVMGCICVSIEMAQDIGCNA
jgi:hypothetical protein